MLEALCTRIQTKLMCKPILCQNDIKVADTLLLRFCRRFVQLNGHDLVTANMHMHLHLTDGISDYRPLSSFWLLPLERYNGMLEEILRTISQSMCRSCSDFYGTLIISLCFNVVVIVLVALSMLLTTRHRLSSQHQTLLEKVTLKGMPF